MSADAQAPADLVETGWAALANGAWRDAYDLFIAVTASESSAVALEGLGLAAWWLDETDVCAQAREGAYRRYIEAGDRRGAARVAAWRSMDHFTRRGEHAMANGWVQRAYRLLDGLEPGPEQAMVACWDAHMAILVEHDLVRARQLYTGAAALAKSLGATDLEMLARAGEGFALVCAGDVAAGMRLLDEASIAVASGEMTDPDAMSLSCCYLIYACERVRDVDRAAKWCDHLRQIAMRWNYHAMFSFCRTHYAGVLIARGDWLQAEIELTASTDELAATHPAMAAEGVARLAELRRRQGRLEDASALLARLDDHPLQMLGQAPNLLGRAAIALDRGDVSAAIALAERFLRSVRSDDRLDRVTAMEILVRGRVANGDRAGAEAALNELEAATANAAMPALRAMNRFSDGVIAVANGDYLRARRQFEDALDAYLQSGDPYDVARTRLELAGVLAGLHVIEQATEEAQLALDALLRLGAGREADRAAALVRQWSRPAETHQRGGAVRIALTPRQVAVLRLVARGMSDKEMAISLGLSEHTIHRHVSNVLTKLDLPSRAAAVAYAAQHDLL